MTPKELREKELDRALGTPTIVRLRAFVPFLMLPFLQGIPFQAPG